MAMPLEYEPEDKDDPAGAEGMTEDDFQAVVQTEIEDAIGFIDQDIAPLREKATLYYRGALFGDEQEGRSQVISRDVHDTVNGVLPSLMRVFFGPEKVVEFVPQGEEDVEMAEQATDYINYIVQRDNPGFGVFWAAFKDALVRKIGIVKYYWDDSVEVKTAHYSGLDPMAVTKLLEDLSQAVDAELTEQTEDENGLSVTIKLKKKVDRARIVAIPPEEFLIDRRARSDEEFTLIGQRREVTHGELIAMGYDEEDLEDLSGDTGLIRNLERQAREITTQFSYKGESGDKSQEPILYIEGYIRIDKDGDGIAELRKVCVAGTGYKVLHEEQVDDHCFAIFPCDPEPHTFFGDSIAEKTMDVQKIKSGVLRASLDSLALSISPRTVVGAGVEISDVLNTEIGALIRARDINQFRTEVTPFVGKEAFPMLAYMDEVRESRTGMSKVAQGLDPGALQNTTALAAANQFNKAHEHVEIIARIIAEVGMKRLFRGLLRITSENQRKARMVQLRNKWVEVDPRSYKTNMDVTCNVALGAGTDKDKLSTLQAIAQKQEFILTTVGPDNPLVTLKQYYNTLTAATSLAGYKNVTQFWSDPDDYQPGPQGEPPPDPKVVAEQMKAQTAQMKMQMDMANAQADREQAMVLGLAEIQAKYQTTMDAAAIKAQMDMLRITADLKIQASEADHRERLQKAKVTGDARAGD